MLKPTRVNSNQFSYNAGNGKFVAEISDFGPDFQFGRVYDDACDEGLTLVSARTQRDLVFVIERREVDDEGDLIAWHLVPASGQEGMPKCSMIIFND